MNATLAAGNTISVGAAVRVVGGMSGGKRGHAGKTGTVSQTAGEVCDVMFPDGSVGTFLREDLQAVPVAVRRTRPVGRYRADHGCAYTPEQVAFAKALDAYKREHRRPHPSWEEVLGVACWLGYQRPGAARLGAAQEFADAMDAYRLEHRRPFPTCCEVLDVLASLGYGLTAGDEGG